MESPAITELRQVAERLATVEADAARIRAERDDLIRRAPIDLPHATIARAVGLSRQYVKRLRG